MIETIRHPLSLATVLLLPVLLNAQQLPDPALLRNRAKGMVDTLAGPDMHGRGYVLNGSGLAADWLEARFKKIGLLPLNESYTEPFTFDVNTFPDTVRMAIDDKMLVPGVDFLVDPASGRSEGTFDLAHLTLTDLSSPERRGVTLGAVTGMAMVLDFPATTNADPAWADALRWTVFALMQAEELGITKANVATKLAEAKANTNQADLRRFLGVEGDFGKQLGLPPDFVVKAVKAVGNYGEIFDRNVGPASALKLDRGLNRQWKDGGLIYSPPFR